MFLAGDWKLGTFCGQRTANRGQRRSGLRAATITSRAMNPSPAVSLTRVSKVFDSRAGRVHALADIDLEVGSGEFVSLIGPSGCGKSTLLRLIGDLLEPSAGSIRNFNDIGTAMLQDAVWVNADWLAEPGNEDIATRFLQASFRGWIFCRDNFDECVQIVLDNGPTLGASHQAWQLNEINKLIWPSPNGIGVMDGAAWAQTVTVATGQGVIQSIPPAGTYRNDLAEAALAGLQQDGLDTTGAGYAPREITLNPGGD